MTIPAREAHGWSKSKGGAMSTAPDSSAPDPVARCRDLGILLSGRTVLDGLSMTVRRGRVHAFLGRNGAGKSTTIRTLLGLLKPDRGSVELFGAPATRAALRRIGASVDGPALYGHLSARDNLTVHARLLGVGPERIDEVLRLVDLDGTGRKRSRSFSTGMQMRLALAIAMLDDPELLILDEPQNGLDPQGIVELRYVLRAHAERGGTVLVSSHQLGEVAHLADDATIIEGGHTCYEGALGDLAPAGQLEEEFLRLTMPVDLPTAGSSRTPSASPAPSERAAR